MRKSRKNREPEQRTITELMTMGLEKAARIAMKDAIRTALNAELGLFLEQNEECRLADGRPALVRNGFHKPRLVLLSSGRVEVEAPRMRDRSGQGIRFLSKLLPPYMRRSPQMDEVIPLLYLAGISTNEMGPSLAVLFGEEQVANLSPAVISRLKERWMEEMETWRHRSLKGTRYAYLWADGVNFNVRTDGSNLCVLVIIGATAEGKKELVALEVGMRENTESWAVLLRDLRERGMENPKLAVGDGALGFWKALREVWPGTREQLCTVHKTRNILNLLPKALRPQGAQILRDLFNAPSRKDSHREAQRFAKVFVAYPRAVENLQKHLPRLLTFFDFPREHWTHIRSTNVIESMFGTVRLRTAKTRGHGSRESTLAMAFQLARKASKRWRKLRHHNIIQFVMQDVRFENGIRKAA